MGQVLKGRTNSIDCSDFTIAPDCYYFELHYYHQSIIDRVLQNIHSHLIEDAPSTHSTAGCCFEFAFSLKMSDKWSCD